MKDTIKTCIAIHDLSTFGRCSLSVILPAMSSLGVQVLPVPTAVYSTHTGGLGDVHKRDLTTFLPEVLEHYQRLELSPSAIYTGYLGHSTAAEHCLDFFTAFPTAYKVVDPVMGDGGKLYRAITPDMLGAMQKMSATADLITPNLTEACALIGREYSNSVTKSELEEIAEKLLGLGAKSAVITGVKLSDSDEFVNVTVVPQGITTLPIKKVEGSYPGTGDLFTARMLSHLLKGEPLTEAVTLAADFVRLAVMLTYKQGTDSRYGVLLEQALLEWRGLFAE